MKILTIQKNKLEEMLIDYLNENKRLSTENLALKKKQNFLEPCIIKKLKGKKDR